MLVWQPGPLQVGTKAGDSTVPRSEDVWIGGASSVSIADGMAHLFCGVPSATIGADAASVDDGGDAVGADDEGSDAVSGVPAAVVEEVVAMSASKPAADRIDEDQIPAS